MSKTVRQIFSRTRFVISSGLRKGLGTLPQMEITLRGMVAMDLVPVRQPMVPTLAHEGLWDQTHCLGLCFLPSPSLLKLSIRVDFQLSNDPWL